MNDRLAFLRAIRANPDDDTLRLVFADWLDEHDDPLGEFVRVQVELEPIRYRIDNPRAVELHAREDALMRQHGDDWLATNALLTNPADYGPVYRRGLPERACLSLDTFLQNGDALFAAHPTLREVALYGLANRCDELTLSPLLANLDTLEIADLLSEDDAASLAVAPHLDRIGRFKFWVGEHTHLLSEIVRQADNRWPREIELVQVLGGGGLGVPAAAGWRAHYREQAEQAARVANTTLGRTAVRVTRPFDRLFPINGDLGHGLCAGHLPDGRLVLAAAGLRFWNLITFNHDGRIQGIQQRPSAVAGPEVMDDDQPFLDSHATEAIDRWRDEEVNMQPGLIWVREFHAPGLTLDLWPRGYADTFFYGTGNTPQAAPRGDLLHWLDGQNFALGWHNEHWLDWRGKIHSS